MEAPTQRGSRAATIPAPGDRRDGAWRRRDGACRRSDGACRRVLVAACLATVGLACASGSGPPSDAPQAGDPAATLAALPPLPGAGLRVALAFGGGADLDLRVRDPGLSVVSYARPRTRAGDLVFEGDRHCGDPAPRIEIARAAVARQGAWLIGVEHRARCPSGASGNERDAGGESVAWVVRIDVGDRVLWRSGRLAPGGVAYETFEGPGSEREAEAPAAPASK